MFCLPPNGGIFCSFILLPFQMCFMAFYQQPHYSLQVKEFLNGMSPNNNKWSPEPPRQLHFPLASSPSLLHKQTDLQ